MAAVTTAVIAAGATAYSVSSAEKQKKEAKKEIKAQRAETAVKEKKQADKMTQADTTAQQRSLRARQKAIAGGGVQGRQATILGGATDAGNTGNQAATGAGKTLLGV